MQDRRSSFFATEKKDLELELDKRSREDINLITTCDVR